MSTKINHLMAVALVAAAGVVPLSAGVADGSGSGGTGDSVDPPVAKVRMADAGPPDAVPRRG